MTEPYHRLMAKEWLTVLVGARRAAHRRLSDGDPGLRHQAGDGRDGGGAGGGRRSARPIARARAGARRSPRPAPRSSSSSTRSTRDAGHRLGEDRVLPPRRVRRACPRRIPRASAATCASGSSSAVHPGAFHFLDGDAPDPAAECRRVGALLAAHPIDVAFVGIGENGHLAFNDPPADFETEEPYLVVDARRGLPAAAARRGLVRDASTTCRARAISMSIRQILKSREILCIVPDARKAQAVRDCLELRGEPAAPGLDPPAATRARPSTSTAQSASLLVERSGCEPEGAGGRAAGARGGCSGASRRARPSAARARARRGGDAHDPDLRGRPARLEPALRPVHGQPLQLPLHAAREPDRHGAPRVVAGARTSRTSTCRSRCCPTSAAASGAASTRRTARACSTRTRR